MCLFMFTFNKLIKIVLSPCFGSIVLMAGSWFWEFAHGILENDFRLIVFDIIGILWYLFIYKLFIFWQDIIEYVLFSHVCCEKLWLRKCT